ncbi:MAG: PEP-CTERM sorting domain-containing protein [Phycisphaerales bacterium]
MAKKYVKIALCLLTLLFSTFASATIIHQTQGMSDTGDSIIFESRLTIDQDLLTLQLFNFSPLTSNSPDDLLSSYFFDIYNSIGQRPELVLISARGDVYQTNKKSADKLQTASADLKAVKSNDNTWIYKPMNPAYNPYLGFAVGTVGNGNLNPNGFPGNIVGAIDYSIYTGDIATQSLSNKLLVKDSLTFTFSGLTGFAESDISNYFMFGMGTKPDTILLNIPEPATLIILGLGGTVLFVRKRK